MESSDTWSSISAKPKSLCWSTMLRVWMMLQRSNKFLTVDAWHTSRNLTAQNICTISWRCAPEISVNSSQSDFMWNVVPVSPSAPQLWWRKMAGKVFLQNIMMSRWRRPSTSCIINITTSSFYPVRHPCEILSEVANDFLSKNHALWGHAYLDLWPLTAKL